MYLDGCFAYCHSQIHKEKVILEMQNHEDHYSACVSIFIFSPKYVHMCMFMYLMGIITKLHIPTCLRNTSRDRDSSIPLGRSFQCLIILSIKNFFLMTNLHLLWCNLRLSLPLTLIPWEKRPALFLLQPPFRSKKFFLQPLLQTKTPQFPQLLLTCVMF